MEAHPTPRKPAALRASLNPELPRHDGHVRLNHKVGDRSLWWTATAALHQAFELRLEGPTLPPRARRTSVADPP